jgi:copper transport protein
VSFLRAARVLLVTSAIALALPAAAWAHAALLRTSPEIGGIISSPPPRILLTYSEAVEPRFAVVSVTDAGGHRVTSGPPARSASDPKTLFVPLRKIKQGWYLVWWRVISQDGHPVRGAFTFAIGPQPGPAPQFVIPSLSETATTPQLLTARWLVFLSLMSAIGLYVLRAITARPVVRAVHGSSLRGLNWALWISLAVALVATPIYVLLATAQFASRSFFDLGNVVPLAWDSAFGRSYLVLECALALFAAAALATIWVDRPERPHRSVAELFAVTGGLGAAAACLLVPGVAGHANTTSPRGLSLAFDWSHLLAASVWIGGLAGLLVLWRSTRDLLRVAMLGLVVPRFSNTALASVLLLIGSGTGAAVLKLPTLATLWQTSYGQALLVKIGLLATAMLLASFNLARTKPRLQAARQRPELAAGAAVLLRRLVAGEAILVWGAVFAAAVLSSLAPPSKALASIGHASARVGPGVVAETVHKNGYTVAVRIAPNRAALPDTFQVHVTRGGKPVRGALVVTSFEMLDMDMQGQAFAFREVAPGTYEKSAPALVMAGHWAVTVQITPRGGTSFEVLLVDRATG